MIYSASELPVRPGRLDSSPAPSLYVLEREQMVTAAKPWTRSFYPVTGERRIELGAAFTVEGAPTKVGLSLSFGAYAAALRWADGAWAAYTEAGPVTVARGPLDSTAVLNAALIGSFGDGEWIATVVNGERRAVTVVPPWPPEPTWPDPEAVLAAHFRGEDDSNLARVLALNPDQALATLARERSEWRRLNEPRPQPAGLASTEPSPTFRFTISCEGPAKSALVLDRVWGVSA